MPPYHYCSSVTGTERHTAVFLKVCPSTVPLCMVLFKVPLEVMGITSYVWVGKPDVIGSTTVSDPTDDGLEGFGVLPPSDVCYIMSWSLCLAAGTQVTQVSPGTLKCHW